LEELATRRSSFLDALRRLDCDAGLVYSSQGHTENFRYLTNFTPLLGDMWAIADAEGGFECVLNFTWQLEEARRASGIDSWQGAFDATLPVVEAVARLRPARLGVVGLARVPFGLVDALRQRLEVELVDATSELALLRRTKSPLEIDRLREAGRATDAALEVVYGEIAPGVTEKEFAARLGYEMHRLGAEWAFPPCVISGVDDPIPVRNPTDRPLASGDTVMVDLGASVEGYCGDASRTVVLGEPSATQEEGWAIVTEAYDAALEACRPGVPCAEVHRAAASIIEEAGYALAHRIGHGIGLATSFEWPSLDTEQSPLAPGVTICIEPGIYAPGLGNMKLEDDILITDQGYELLTNARRELVISG
jgi:Xaa-Pro aminopeptidase